VAISLFPFWGISKLTSQMGTAREKGEVMKKEYDFSKGVRGKFYRSNLKLSLPVYLDDDVAEIVQKYAKRKKVDAQTVVNKLLRTNKEIVQALQ